MRNSNGESSTRTLVSFTGFTTIIIHLLYAKTDREGLGYFTM